MNKAAVSSTIAVAVLALSGAAITGSPAQADYDNKQTVVLKLKTMQETQFGNSSDPTPGATFGATGALTMHGKHFGSYARICTVAASTPRRIICESGFRTPDGQFETRAFTEGNFAVFSSAVTGGTARFRNVTGEAEFGPSSGGTREIIVYLNGVRR
ncbi:hypothetical protein [Streptomyces marianii]|uniref:Dirigent protein n=1 Tax=Streptomyces marianii TaxID=1817406 RepID=A0A5R9E386_9ACTN|nr:hypothetical protein [Streptomyces marianii]TLQ43837.1 hypothetical protein FEF34_12420 [Streptomyces marianii]